MYVGTVYVGRYSVGWYVYVDAVYVGRYSVGNCSVCRYSIGR